MARKFLKEYQEEKALSIETAAGKV